MGKLVGLLAFCTFVTVGAGAARAQRLESYIPPLAATTPAPLPPPRPTPGETAVRPRHSLLNTTLYCLGGALVGGWVGYMSSQVIMSDWHDAGEPTVNRARYGITGAVAGAVLGAVVGHYRPVRGAATHPTNRMVPAITTEQIRASGARTAAEVVQLLRPQWLRALGADAFSKQGSPEQGVRVYRDGVAAGGIEMLAEVPSAEISRIEYYDMRAATLRWGAGHSHGAINVVSVGGSR